MNILVVCANPRGTDPSDSLAYPAGAMTRAEAESQLAQIHADLLREPTDAAVYMGFMMASLAAFLVAAFHGENAEVHRERALWAAEQGAKRPSLVSKEIPKQIRVVGLLMKLLMEQPDALMTIVEVAVRDALREVGAEQPRCNGRHLCHQPA